MIDRIVIPAAIYQQLKSHLFATDTVEREAFMIGGWSGAAILVRRIIPINSEDLDEEGGRGLSLKDKKKVEVVRECKKEGGCLVEAHTHPFSTDHVDFSRYDRDNLQEFVKYIRIRLPNTPYCATVWGTGSVSALVWAAGGRNPKSIKRIDVRGSTMARIFPANSNRPGILPVAQADLSVYDRQIRAFGESGQEKISTLRVGIVGVGGIGSHVLQQLAYLGVKEIVIIDDDKIDKTNLNRLVGATRKDTHKFKTKVLASNARRINPSLRINDEPMRLRSAEALEELTSVDLVFGCVDNDGARLVLAELAASYLIPYFDCASSIELEDTGITQSGGRVLCYLPMESACLWCSKQIDQREASFDLASEGERNERLKRGYYNVAGPQPAVVSLNGVVASLVINEYLALATGFRKPINVRYDAILARTREQKWDVDRNCVICQATFGLGDRANLERYVIK